MSDTPDILRALVKPLEWKKSERGARFEETTCGGYVIFYRHGGGSCLSWGATCETVSEFEADYLGRKAKAAAEADHAARVLAALDTDKLTALVETAQWARNRLEIIADKSWHGDGRDLKRSIIGIFADFDAALAAFKAITINERSSQ